MDVLKAIKNLEARGIKAKFFETKEEASDYIVSTVENTTVGIGGSMSAKELELYPRLSEKNQVFWHWECPQDGKNEIMRAMNAKVYISGVNAIAETGEIVNIDGAGNRVASCLYAKDKVIFLAGINKLEKDLNTAIYRARNVSAPKNAARLNKKTPCAIKGDKCYDCHSPERICNAMVITMGKLSGVKEIEVVFVNQELGF